MAPPAAPAPLRGAMLVAVAVTAVIAGTAMAIPRLAVRLAPTHDLLGLPVADAGRAHAWLYGLRDDARVVTTRGFRGIDDPGWVVVLIDRVPADRPETVTSVAALASSLARRAEEPGFSGRVGAYLRHDATFRAAFHVFRIRPDDVPRLRATARAAAPAAGD